MSEIIRAVDLFSGCGGMSLGFELYHDLLNYRVVMALDNDSQRVNCYNANFPKAGNTLGSARLCDLNWFNHPTEVLLYYLLHYALWKPDSSLRESLESPEINIHAFLSQLRRIDQDFQARCFAFEKDPIFLKSLSEVDSKIFSMAICRAFFTRLGLALPKSLSTLSSLLPWKEEYILLFKSDSDERDISEILVEIEAGLHHQWDSELVKLKEASGKQGRGQHAPVAARLQTLVSFLTGDAGLLMKNIWLEWRSRRDSLRAIFCTNISERLLALYSDERRVQLLLGGPPCKGFSRIGRAVVASLREQGIHSWASHEYGDERNALLHKYVLFLEALRPDVFVFENVAHFKSALKTPSGVLDAASILQESIEELSNSKLHFDVIAQIVRAREHAIPQDRERFIMVGFNQETSPSGIASNFFRLEKYTAEVPLLMSLIGLEKPGEFSHTDPSSCKSSYKTKAYTFIDYSMPDSFVKYLKWIRQPKPGSKKLPGTTDAHVVRQARPDDLALIEKFAPGKRWMDYKLTKSQTLSDIRDILGKVLAYQRENESEDFPSVEKITEMLNRISSGLLLRLLLEELKLPLGFQGEHHLLLNGYLDKGTDNHGDWFERLSANRPCKTIVAHIGKDTYGYIHPFENRALSMRETARIQSFPDFYSFKGVGIVDGYAMIGDAVPPLLAYLFAERLAILHKEYKIFNSINQKRKISGQHENGQQLGLALL